MLFSVVSLKGTLFFGFFCMIFLFSNQANAQTDSLSLVSDTVAPADPRLINLDTELPNKKIRNSKKALTYSAILPGLGQSYNRKYWKIPIIYGGFAGLALVVDFNQKKFKQFSNELVARSKNDPSNMPDPALAVASNERIVELKNFYKRNRDFSILGIVGLYGLNIIDAYVDAELSGFDISDDLSLKITPYLQPPATIVKNQPAFTGLKFTFTL